MAISVPDAAAGVGVRSRISERHKLRLAAARLKSIVQPHRTLLAVHAHPDDEAITTGGILARFSEGIRTVVVTCTSGDAGENRLPGDDALDELRERELRECLRILRVSRGVRLAYGDSGFPGLARPGSFSQIPLEQAAEAIAGALREEQPDVVVTYDADGGYGHPDHVRAHEATVLAHRLAAPAAALYAVVFPRTVLRRFTEVMAAAGMPVRMPALLGIEDLDVPEDFGTPEELVSDRVDVAAYVETKRLALAAHRSQVGEDHALLRMPPAVRREVWGTEYFRRLA